jgi:hypothetical protein
MSSLSAGRRAGFTLLCGYVFVFLGFLTMLVLWDENAAYWRVGLGYAFVGIGVELAGTPASRSLTGSVPVPRASMASGTADLQRDFGGAFMQSIFGALLTAGYVSAATSQVPSDVNSSVQSQLTKSFSSAADTASQYPQYANQIIAGARSSFLDGVDWAYTTGLIAMVAGAVLVFFCFPKHQREQELLDRYHEDDQGAAVNR